VMVLLLVLGPMLLPEFRNPDAGHLDLFDVVLSLAGILPVIWGLKELARNGWSGAPIAAIVGGLIVGAVFLWRQGRVPVPLLDLGLFKSRIFSASLGVMLLAGVVMAGTTLLSALYLQVVKGLSPLSAGLYLLPQNIAMIVGSMMAPALAQKIRPAYVMAIGLIVSAIGLTIVSQVDSTASVWLLVVGLTVTSGGLALPMTQTGNLVLSSAPPEKAGGAAGIMEASGEFGVAVGVAVMGSLGTLVYRSELPDNLPADVSRVASESITAAAAVAAKLGGTAGADLLTAARVAFTDSLDIVAGLGALIFAALAVTSIAVLRNAKTPAPFMPPGVAGAGAPPGGAAESATAGSTTEA
jgi:DHA2 family multidrug resistance protein-like MFS transporter